MTTLCYIEKDDSYLMMHRTVKKLSLIHISEPTRRS